MNPMILAIITWERQAETRRAALAEKPQSGLPAKPRQPPASRTHTQCAGPQAATRLTPS